MAKGGKRPGAGRKRGVPNKINQSMREKILKSGITPMEFFATMMRAPRPERHEGENILSYHKRLELWSEERKFAAKELAPFVHSKLSSVEITGEDGEAIQHQHRVEIEFVEPKR